MFFAPEIGHFCVYIPVLLNRKNIVPKRKSPFEEVIQAPMRLFINYVTQEGEGTKMAIRGNFKT